jgi:hypothetical protein
MASELDGLFVRCVVRGVIVLALCARVLRDVTARALSQAAHTRTLSTARRTRWRRLLDVDDTEYLCGVAELFNLAGAHINSSPSKEAGV